MGGGGGSEPRTGIIYIYIFFFGAHNSFYPAGRINRSESEAATVFWKTTWRNVRNGSLEEDAPSLKLTVRPLKQAFPIGKYSIPTIHLQVLC